MLTGHHQPARRRATVEDAVARATVQRILERVRTVPGVTAAGVTTTLPFSGAYSDSVILAEGYQMQKGESLISPSQVVVSDGYFEAMGARLLSGRFFNDRRRRDGRPRVLVIDEELAERFWPNGDALGKRMYYPDEHQEPDREAHRGADADHRRHHRADAAARAGRVAGVGADRAYYFRPFSQQPSRTLGFVAVRTTQAPERAHRVGAARDRADRSGAAVLRRADHGRSAVGRR